jgi:hypothetical protein
VSLERRLARKDAPGKPRKRQTAVRAYDYLAGTPLDAITSVSRPARLIARAAAARAAQAKKTNP